VGIKRAVANDRPIFSVLAKSQMLGMMMTCLPQAIWAGWMTFTESQLVMKPLTSDR